MSRPAGCAPGAEPRGGRPCDPRGAGARLRRPGAIDLRPQELLLSRPAQGLSDFAVRAAARHRRRRRRAQRLLGARLRHPDHPHPHGRGRGQAAPRGVSRFRSPQLRRSEPRRHPAHRDRDRARLPSRQARRRVFRLPSRAARRHRRQRRQHGRGQPALRRQRLGAQAGGAARHQGRDQEPELVPVSRRRDRARDRAAGRAARSRRAGRAGDAALGRRRQTHRVDAQQGGGARLPLLP